MQADFSTHALSLGRAQSTGATVHVNGVARLTLATTLAALIEEVGYGDARVATAINGKFVPARSRAVTSIAPGDQIEILAPRQGG
jgi:sulfur carrier protein